MTIHDRPIDETGAVAPTSYTLVILDAAARIEQDLHAEAAGLLHSLEHDLALIEACALLSQLGARLDRQTGDEPGTAIGKLRASAELGLALAGGEEFDLGMGPKRDRHTTKVEQPRWEERGLPTEDDRRY